MKERNTIQKTIIKEKIFALKNHPGAEQIYMEVILTHPFISKATVYRNLNNMAANGEILKIGVPSCADRFDYQNHNHYHMQCKFCGGIFDIEIGYLKELDEKAKNASKFEISSHDIIFKGLCNNCKKDI